MSRLLSAEWPRCGKFAIIQRAMTRPLHPESVEAIALRLLITREAMDLDQAEICRRATISTSAWNNWETGDNRIGIDSALKLCAKFGWTLDWIYRGLMPGLPGDLLKKIEGKLAESASRRG